MFYVNRMLTQSNLHFKIFISANPGLLREIERWVETPDNYKVTLPANFKCNLEARILIPPDHRPPLSNVNWSVWDTEDMVNY